ncbi:hypothetical protein [Burkholderia sp. MSMB1072]|uniref:hypothetical protein n=1 Tax=Burkholderia sp. MSMB1072 TaxID=1637871 RepID=UPI00359C2800
MPSIVTGNTLPAAVARSSVSHGRSPFDGVDASNTFPVASSTRYIASVGKSRNIAAGCSPNRTDTGRPAASKRIPASIWRMLSICWRRPRNSGYRARKYMESADSSARLTANATTLVTHRRVDRRKIQ